jgi:mannose-6-phosphate isomerase-like protein (cupin superfamily)
MKITSLAETRSRVNPNGIEAKTIYDHDQALISHLKLLPGEALKKHVTPVDVAFYVLEGRGEVEIGEEKETVGQDTMVESPKGITYLWRNLWTSPLRIMVMKHPRPTEKSKML